MTSLHTITLSAPVAIQASGQPKPRRFKVDPAYSGGKLNIVGYDLPLIIDLAGLKPRSNVTANLDHVQDRRVGHVDAIENNGQSLTLAGVVSAASESAAEFLASAERGYPWSASVEVQPHKLEEIPAGKTVNVNGQQHAGPLLVTRRGTLYGIAFLPQGADENARAVLATRKRKMKTASFEAWGRDLLGSAFDTLDKNQLARLHANYLGRDDESPADFAAAASMIQAGAELDDEELRLRRIERSLAREDRLKKLEESLPMTHAPTSSRRHASDNKVLTAALCLSAGVQSPEKHFDERTLDAADQHRGIGLQQVLLQAAVANGYQPTGSIGINAANLRQVLAYALPSIQATGFSTINVPTIVSNTANKFLKEGWDSVDQTLLRIAAVRSVRDFKQITTVSLTGGMQFEQVGPAGEIKHGTLGEVSYTNQAYTYGAICAITRQDIINDDTGALSAAPRKIGRGGMLKLNAIGWTAFLAGESTGFFSATHTNPTGNSNLNTGVADMTLGGIAATEKLFINQIDPDGNPLGLMPAILLVPPTLKAAAMGLMNSQLIISGTATASQPSGNVWQGRFRVESSPYMEISSYTGYSAAAWYLIAEPSQLAAIEIAALNGRVEPTVETAEADFAQLGIQMRGYSDVGVSLMEYRAAVKADGGAS